MAEINLEFKCEEEPVKYQDKIIYEYIMQNPDKEDYFEITEMDDRFFVFYHLSDYRAAAVRWYPFKSGASILEIDGEMGAITGALCDRGEKVTVTENSVFCAKAIAQRYNRRKNLTVYAGDLAQAGFTEKFDYIILFGNLERAGRGSSDNKDYIQYLKYVMQYLKQDGRILLAVENLYGIQNLCGKRESHTGIPFDGIAGYPGGTSARGFHRKQLEEIITQAGLKKYKFYYPVPDYVAPQIIYTDEWQPGNNILERLRTFYPDNRTLVADDRKIYLDCIKNGCFPFMANSFLVEAGCEVPCSDVNYVTLSVSRGREKSFATMVSGRGNVWKRCMYPEGTVYAGELCGDIESLKQRNIPVVDMMLKDDIICMDYIDAPTLQQYISMLVETKAPTGQILEIFDRLWELILRSSELTDECVFGGTTADWGPILKRAYIEMIPLNCFWRDGELLFYDQEFVKENYPAKFVIMRAIRNTYLFIQGMEEYLSQEILKKRYGLSEEIWKICIEKDNEFVVNVNWQRMRWIEKDEKRMWDNRQTLSVAGKVLQEIPKDGTLIKRVHEVQMDLLAEFMRVCEKYRIQFYIIYGTLLGAVRHGGVIPWDDDIDLALPREDYNKLLEVAEKEFTGRYFLQTPWNDECFYGGYLKLRNTQTTAIEEKNWWVHCCEGISMDIFPLDYGYHSKWKEKRKESRIRFYQRLLYAKAYGYFARFMDMPLPVWKFYKYLGLPASRQKLADRLDHALAEGDVHKDRTPVGIYAHYKSGRDRKADRFRMKDFRETVKLKYDDMMLPAPAGFDYLLKKRYGRNYMDIPGREEGQLRHAFYAVNVPYQNYRKRFSGLFKPAPAADKEIVLFGDDAIIEAYFQRYGSKYRPAHIVRTAGSCVKTEFYGIVAEEFEEFQAGDLNRVYPVICTVYIREAENRLRRAGYRDYYIYIDKREWIRLEDPGYAMKELEKEDGDDE